MIWFLVGYYIGKRRGSRQTLAAIHIGFFKGYEELAKTLQGKGR